MRKRILHIAILTVALAAGSRLWLLATPSIDPPRTVGAWALSGKIDCVNVVPAEIRDWRGTSGARRVCRAEYAGSPTMWLTLIEMPGSPGRTAFDAWQKWQPAQPGKLGFYKGRYFGVVESPELDRETLDRFTVAVQRSLPSGSEGRW